MFIFGHSNDPHPLPIMYEWLQIVFLSYMKNPTVRYEKGITYRAEFDFVNKNHPGSFLSLEAKNMYASLIIGTTTTSTVNPRFDFEILSCLIWFDNDLKSQGEWNLSEMIISLKASE